MTIDIYGLVIRCQAGSPEFGSELIRPFKYFRKDNSQTAVTVIVKEENPPYKSFPSVGTSFSTPRNIVYKDRDRKIIDYFGKGVIIEDDKKMIYKIYSRDRNFLMEAFYLLILSIFGQFCDKKGILRVHALGVSYRDKAFLLITPPGGGKSTMALSILQEEDIRLISDESPLFDRFSYILAIKARGNHCFGFG